LEVLKDVFRGSHIWFLEASAVMMEDEVYDNVNDYVNYLKYYVNKTNLPIEYHNSDREYGKVLFAKFFKAEVWDEFYKIYL